MRKSFVLAALFASVVACAPSRRSPVGSPSPVGPEATASVPSELVNTVRWSTASEHDNFGFDVYRSKREDGPFDRITAEPIPGAGTSAEPSHYTFVDDTIEPDTRYYYFVESISMQGERERFTPVQSAPPKPAPEA